jgi:hypothetical protein
LTISANRKFINTETSSALAKMQKLSKNQIKDRFGATYLLLITNVKKIAKQLKKLLILLLLCSDFFCETSAVNPKTTIGKPPKKRQLPNL